MPKSQPKPRRRRENKLDRAVAEFHAMNEWAFGKQSIDSFCAGWVRGYEAAQRRTLAPAGRRKARKSK